MTTSAQKKLIELLVPLQEQMDQEAKDILDGFLGQLQPGLVQVELSPSSAVKVDAHQHVFQGFLTKTESVLVVWDKNPKPDLLATQVELLEYNQFRSHAEDSIYCRGTVGLLELLTQYRKHKTEKTVIMATPAGLVAGGPLGGNLRSYINEHHLKTHYGDHRQVTVSILTSNGCVAFSFEKKSNRHKE